MIQLLKNRLKKRTNKQYIKWWVENKKISGSEGHHLLGSFLGGTKQNDLLMSNVSLLLHNKITYHKEQITELDTNEMIIASLDDIFDYVEFLQNEVLSLEEKLSSTSN